MRVCLVVFSLCFYAASVIASEINVHKFPFPDYFKIQVVADNMDFNGSDMGILQFVTDRKFKDVKAFYESEVGNIKVTKFGDWKIISWYQGDVVYTIQATSDPLENRLHGFMAQSNVLALRNKKVELGVGIPKLTGSSILNDIKAIDLGKHSRTVWLTNKSNVRSNLSYYKTHYRNKGWSLLQEKIHSQSKSGVIKFQKGADELTITATKENDISGTSVLILLVEK